MDWLVKRYSLLSFSLILSIKTILRLFYLTNIKTKECIRFGNKCFQIVDIFWQKAINLCKIDAI